MLSKVSTVALMGIEAREVAVEVQIAAGLPSFVIVGLPDKAVAESKERIRASFFHMGLSLPQRRIIVNLAPADLQKEGAHYDLPIALAIMSALGIFDAAQLQEYVILGGLGLDAMTAPVAGVLPAALFASSSGRGLICPTANRSEAFWAGKDLQILAAPDLTALVNHFRGEAILVRPYEPPQDIAVDTSNPYGDISDIKGQSVLKRVCEIAAAGRHNLLMVGPPGAGKSMIAQRMMSILPPLAPREAIETTMIYSVAGMLPESGLITHRPFRAPHHSASLVSLVGGGARAKPGEISLAHHGVLFLDELPEFARPVLESLRQPLETGEITIARANQHITYPARIQLIAAMNPCRCGYFGTLSRECARAPRCAQDYQTKISGPLLDRFDLVVYVPQVPVKDLMVAAGSAGPDSATLRRNVTRAWAFQAADAPPPIQKIEQLADPVQRALRAAMEQRRLSARGVFRVLKVAQTIAALQGSRAINPPHIAEAIQYRYVMAQAAMPA